MLKDINLQFFLLLQGIVHCFQIPLSFPSSTVLILQSQSVIALLTPFQFLPGREFSVTGSWIGSHHVLPMSFLLSASWKVSWTHSLLPTCPTDQWLHHSILIILFSSVHKYRAVQVGFVANVVLNSIKYSDLLSELFSPRPKIVTPLSPGHQKETLLFTKQCLCHFPWHALLSLQEPGLC